MELMITIVIISIFAGFCFPLYSHYLVRARRFEAETELTKLAIAMEKFNLEHNSYEQATLAVLEFPELIAKNNYRLMIQSATAEDYLLIAEPLNKQAESDANCGELILNADGKKMISGSGDVNKCWV